MSSRVLSHGRPSPAGHREGTDQSQPLLHARDGNSGQTYDGEEHSKAGSGDSVQEARSEDRGLLNSSPKEHGPLHLPVVEPPGLLHAPSTASPQNDSHVGGVPHCIRPTGVKFERHANLDFTSEVSPAVGHRKDVVDSSHGESSLESGNGQPEGQEHIPHNTRPQGDAPVHTCLKDAGNVRHAFPKTSLGNVKKHTSRPGLPNLITKSDLSSRYMQPLGSESTRGTQYDLGLAVPGSRPTSGVLQIVPEDDREDDVFLPSDQDLEQETSFTNDKMQNKVRPSVVLNIDAQDGEKDRVATSQGGPSSDLPKNPVSGKTGHPAPRFLDVPKGEALGLPQWSAGNDPTRPERRKTLAHLSPKDCNHLLTVPSQGAHASSPQGRKLSLPYQPPIVQMRRPSKTYTVIHYGNVGKEASTTVPTGHEQVDRLDFFDVEAGNEGMLDTAQDSQKQINRQISRQLSEDRQSIISLKSGGDGKRKRLLSIQHVSQADLGTLDGLIDANDTVDTAQLDTCITMESPQQTFNGSRMYKDKKVQAMAEYGKMYAMRKRNRLIHKDGSINVRPANISKRACQFLLDIFTTLLDLPWRWVWSLFIIAFVLSWFVFAIIWWLIGYANGDFNQLIDSERPEKCVDGIEGFPSAFLFSIETQHTIGYGTRAVTTKCPLAFIVIMIQSLLGVVIQCVLAGVVFAKLAKPKNRAETIMFSKKAAISIEDGYYCLVFRVGDMRRSQLIGCNLHAFLVREHVTKEGRRVELQREHLEVLSESEDYDQYLFLAWPTKIIHRITPHSPLWDVSRASLLAEQFEIIVVLEGTIESSGMITQIRNSYLPSEIEWGQRFRNLLTEQKSGGVMEIDYSNFSRTEAQLEMPDISAHAHYQVNAAGSNTAQSQTDRRMSHRSNVSFYRGF